MGFTAFLGGLPKGSSEEEVADFCRGYGKLTDIQIRSSSKDFFAFVTFSDERLGHDCVEELNEKEFNRTGNRVMMKEAKSSKPQKSKVERGRSRSPGSPRSRGRGDRERDYSEEAGVTLWMGGLPRGVRDDEIAKFAKAYGEITNIHIRSNEKDVFAFVTFADGKLGRRCMHEMDQMLWFGEANRIKMRVTENKRSDREVKRRRPSSSAPRKGDRQEGYRIELRDLPVDMTWSELKDIGRDFGQSVHYADVFIAGGLTCGVVEYRDLDHARYALEEFNGRFVEGHRYRIQSFKNWS